MKAVIYSMKDNNYHVKGLGFYVLYVKSPVENLFDLDIIFNLVRNTPFT